MTAIYGIKNCDTMKKALTWLEENHIPFTFHDYKKEGVDAGIIENALAQHGWETVINRRGTTWRKLPEDVQTAMNDNNALQVALDNPSIIKRPLLVKEEVITLGFKNDTYSQLFKG